ncbi:MAG: hypothetical protein V4543_13890 [Bacteroidota bacterium]
MRRLLLPAAMLLVLMMPAGCATYYQKNYKFFMAFENGNMKEASSVIQKAKPGRHNREKLLYYMNSGTVHSIMGEYEQSNKDFEEAYRLSEDYATNYVNEGLAFLVNPTVVDYKGEDHEILLIHYYMALNYLKMGLPNEALVECKRMNDLLNRLSDKYKSDNKYKRDAFVHNLMGIIYDVNSDPNNAFIAYRNAYNIYQDDYSRLFKLSAPEQLKRDLIRTAYQSGFADEGSRYEAQFNMKNQPVQRGNGELVFLWHNGLGPVKDEWGINFTIIRGSGGMVTFHNEDMGLNFPFYLGEDEKDKAKGLARLEFIRVVFPKYQERAEVFTGAKLEWNGRSIPLEKGIDVNAVAYKTLDERFLAEMGKSLLRVAIKKVEEESLRRKNQDAGAVLGLINAITEKADTRNWQTLPHSISYARISMPAGDQKVDFTAIANNGAKNDVQSFTYNVKAGQTIFQTQSSLDYVHMPIHY